MKDVQEEASEKDMLAAAIAVGVLVLLAGLLLVVAFNLASAVFANAGYVLALVVGFFVGKWWERTS